jgi:intein/homing endonuclease
MKINTKYEILTPNGFEDFDGIQKLKKSTIELFFENGLQIRGSFNHQIFDFDGNPILLSEVKVGDKIKSHDGFLIVKDIKKHYNKTNVYDIINSGKDHVYYSNDIISHNCDFLGSGDGVIPGEIQQNISKNFIRQPIEKYMQGTFWQWKEPVQGHRYIMGCLPPGEKVLTDDGLLDIEQVDVKHKLVNEDGSYVNIINKQIYDVVDENVYEVSVDNTFRTTKFTKEHPLLVSPPTLKRNWKKYHPNISFKTRYWDFDFKYKKVSEVSVGDWIKVPNIYKKEINFDINKKWELNDDVRKDFTIESPLLNKDFWWFIGLWLGDGWIEKYKYSQGIVICFNKNEKHYLQKCEEIVKILFNRTPSIVERESTFDLSFNSKELYNFIIDNFGQYSYGKKITEWIKFIPNEFKKEIIKGYFDSDGCWISTTKNGKINSKISFVSINLELLEGIQDILFSLGVISSLNKLRDSSEHSFGGKVCKTKITYSLNLSNYDSLQLHKLIYDKDDIKLNKFDITVFSNINKRVISSCHFDDDNDFIYFRIKKINKTNYTGKVYNFECDTHTFMCHHITTHNCDVSRGDSEDFSSINIVDFDEREQVAEYIGKIPPDDLASICYKWGILYEAFIVVDITGGMGIATSRKLQEMNYKNLYIDGVNTQNMWEYNRKALEKIPGLNFNNKRTQIVAAFEEQLRKGFAVRSSRLLNELNTFVYINGRPDHMKGAHDDAIMSLSMALYAADMCFNQLQKNENANKAMLESWTISERTYEPNRSFYSYGTAFDQIGSMSTDHHPGLTRDMGATKEQYKQYSWLFGKKK